VSNLNPESQLSSLEQEITNKTYQIDLENQLVLAKERLKIIDQRNLALKWELVDASATIKALREEVESLVVMRRWFTEKPKT